MHVQDCNKSKLKGSFHKKSDETVAAKVFWHFLFCHRKSTRALFVDHPNWAVYENKNRKVYQVNPESAAWIINEKHRIIAALIKGNAERAIFRQVIDIRVEPFLGVNHFESQNADHDTVHSKGSSREFELSKDRRVRNLLHKINQAPY
jgi:hypothetical protein